MVRDQLPLIQDVQTDEWWQDVTAPMLENARKKLRSLVRFIEKARRKPIYTDFEDRIGEASAVELPGFAAGTGDFERFRDKARAFLREHQDHDAVRKVRTNARLTPKDLADLEQMLAGSGVGSVEEIEKAKAESHGLGLFIRSLVGLDREAAKQAFAGFLAGRTLGANQIEFVNLIVNHLTEHGVMDAALLYESPFTDITPRGPDGIFTEQQVEALVAILREVQATAMAA
jgi:type I restriction enzyme R subunit